MDALPLLKWDHQTVEKLFARFEKKSSKEIANRFVRELAVHAAGVGRDPRPRARQPEGMMSREGKPRGGRHQPEMHA